MSCLWICLSLLYAATFLQSSASSSDGVSLKCNETVEVVAGKTVTLYCTIFYSLGYACKGANYLWSNTHDDILCNSGLKYNCEWDSLTYVSLTISNVEMQEETYTVHIDTDCGMAQSSIKVQVQQHRASIHGETRSTRGPEQATKSHVAPAILGIFVTLIGLGILFFLFGTERGRNVIKCTKKEKTQGDHSDTDTALGSEDSLIV